MEISKLLTEKEELDLKIQELINKYLQPTKEKEELCEKYEEKLNRWENLDSKSDFLFQNFILYFPKLLPVDVRNTMFWVELHCLEQC